jgi:hypothetical protein
MWEAPSSEVSAVGSDYLLAVAAAYKVRPESINDAAADHFPWSPSTTTDHSASPLVKLDAEMLADTAWVMRKAYADVGRVFDIETEPERFLLAYMTRSQLTDIKSPDNVAAFLFAAKKLVPSPGVNDERSSAGPAPGPGTKDVGGRARRRKA